jgi:purine nucleosidase
VVRLHLDTDLAGDPDDVAALAYLLGRDEVELTGVTTVDDPGGQRAGYVAEVLRLAGRRDVPVAAGAAGSLSTGRPSGTVDAGPRYWPAEVPARPGPLDAALDLLVASVATGAVLVGIGPATTLALLERRSPGTLGDAHVVLMGGWVGPPADGMPAWRAEDDWNVVCDPVAATEVRRSAGRLTVVPLAVTAQVHLRDRDLPRLAASGPVGRLMAGQAAAYRDDRGKRALGLTHAGLPDDLANFHHDPLTVAVATGWPGVTTETRALDGRDVDLVTGVDGPSFGEHWLSTVESLHRG